MSQKNFKLFVGVDEKRFSFTVIDTKNEEDPKIVHTNETQVTGVIENKITDPNEVYDILKTNTFEIERKLNCVFKEAILILDSLNSSIINLSGYKKLNGSQLTKGDITYILNSLKSEIHEKESQKSTIHIFNSNYHLDKKKINNLPIGLFGNFYSQELSFYLIDNNDFKNFNNIFNKCNLSISKIISKSFLEGVNLINQNSNLDSFFNIEINEFDSKIFLFENSALKFAQNFKFGTNLIEKDISKVLALNIDNVKRILRDTQFNLGEINDQCIEEEFFKNQNFRKIKKKLILEIAEARIQEISNIIIFKNINLIRFLNNQFPIFLKIKDAANLRCFEENYKLFFSHRNNYKLHFKEEINIDKIYHGLFKLVQYGWKREAVPVIHEKKSLIARFFDLLFN